MSARSLRPRALSSDIQGLTHAQLKAELKNSEKKFFRILSLDGGGIRGILPGQVVARLEKILQEVTGDENARVAEFFDLIAGTSTGGILTCVYVRPDKKGKPIYSAKDAVDLYYKNGTEIFTRSWGRKLTTVGGVIGAKYSAKPIEKYLYQYLEDSTLKDVAKFRNLADCLITNFDMSTGRSSFLTSFDVGSDKSSGDGVVPNMYLKDVARSTSAAPTYFPPAYVAPIGTQDFKARIDGGVFANNPTLAALVEALKMETDDGDEVTIRNISILSIGTKGNKHTTYKFNKIKSWGLAKWVQPIINIMMDGVADTTDFLSQRVYSMLPEADEYYEQYLRVAPDVITANGSMDAASKKNLDKLMADGEKAADENEMALRSAVKYLLSGRQEQFPGAFT